MGLWNGIGNGIGRKKRGIDWSSYWATLQSATVENAAPTHVVLTFPTAQTSLGATDFTIAGFTISSASWAGAVLTLVVTPAVLFYHRNLTITFGKTGETAVVTNNVAVANTVGWYVAGDGSSTYVTKDGSDFVSVWKDLSGSNNPLNQATGTSQPKWQSTGILFDGVDNYMKAPVVRNQPQTIYVVLKTVTWGSSDYYISGNNLGSAMQLLSEGGSPNIRCYNGANSGLTPTTIGAFVIIRIVFNGANSSLQVNNAAAVTGNFGANNGITICIGSYGTTDGASNIEVKEAIFRNAADDAATQISIYNYLANKYGFATI